MGSVGFEALAWLAHELTLFAAVAFLLGGASDILVDLVWLGRALRRQMFVFRTHCRADATTLAPPRNSGRIAIFIPAWDEGAVIGEMLRHTVVALAGADCAIYVGVYPNDPATIAGVSAVATPQVRMVVNGRAGPTTKADCLNTLWRQMLADEAAAGVRFKAIVLHDAEDVVHPAEPRIFDALIERFDLIQLPVLPLVDAGSRWVSGHYIDEFSSHHSRTIVAREVIGAGIPSAGVGCAFARDMLGMIAEGRDGPFDARSLTEDYELGLRIRALGGRGAFVRLPEFAGGPLVCVRAHFPATLLDAVIQKSRWIAGIALSGWDRLGWQGGLAETWMRIDDRRTVLAAVVMLAAYVALMLNVMFLILALVPGIDIASRGSPALSWLLLICSLLLVWRLAVRAVLVARLYGWREGVRSVPRTLVANVIDMMAARRAVGIYMKSRREGVVRWDKTRHRFPVDPAAAR